MTYSTIVFRIRSYVSVITEKNDLSFQLTHRTLTFELSDSECGKTRSTRYVKRTTNSVDLRTSNILITVLPTIDQLIKPRKTNHFKKAIKDNTQKYSLSAKNRGGERSSMRQFMHPVHPKAKYSYCFGSKAGKIRRQGRQKNKKEKQQRQCTAKTFLFRRRICTTKVFPYQIACVARLPKLSFLAAVALP